MVKSVDEVTAFDNFADLSHVELPFEARTGSGGDDLSSWSSDQAIVDNLLTGTYTNASSYSIPKIVAENTDFDNFAELSHTSGVDSSAQSGTGGTDMAAWGSNQTISKQLLVGNYTNASSYAIPAVVYEASSYDNFKELSHSTQETGVKVGYTYLGTRISGTVYLTEKDGEASPNQLPLGNINFETAQSGVTFTATSDPQDGSFELPVGDGGEYNVVAKHPLLDEVEKTLTLNPGESRPNTDFYIGIPSGGAGGLSIGGGANLG